MGEALAAAAIWLLFFAAAVVITAAPPRPAAARPPDGLPPDGPPPAGAAARPPAFLNLCVTRGKLDEAAYAATILGLAAHGVLVLTGPEAGQLRCALPPAPVDDPGLASFERLVLVTVTGRLTADGPAPFQALAGRCSADVPGTWDPFERAVRREGRQCGLTRSRLPVTVTGLLYTGAATLGLLTFPAVSARPHTGLWAALTAAFFAILLPAYWIRWPARSCWPCSPPPRSPPERAARSRWRAGWPSPPRRPSTARSSPAGSSAAAAGTTTSMSPASRWTTAAGLERGYQPRRVRPAVGGGPGPGPGLPPVREAARAGSVRAGHVTRS